MSNSRNGVGRKMEKEAPKGEMSYRSDAAQKEVTDERDWEFIWEQA